jgi:hypothetical protein
MSKIYWNILQISMRRFVKKNVPKLKRVIFISKSLHWCFIILNMRKEMRIQIKIPIWARTV